METRFRKGERVIYHYRERRRVMWSDTGYGMVDVWKRAWILTQPRDAEGRFVNTDNCWEDETYVKLRDEDGKIFDATIDEIEHDYSPSQLSERELEKLWKEICRGSMYYDDYRNSLGVFQNTAYDYYEGFMEFLASECDEDEEQIEKMDTPENFAEYCLGVCA